MPTIKPLKDAAGIKAVLYSGANRNFDWTLTLKDTAGVAVDITGWVIKAVMKQTVSDADIDALLLETTCTVGSGPGGVFTLPLAAATLVGEASDAMLVIWRELSGNKKVLCQYYIDVLDSALD